MLDVAIQSKGFSSSRGATRPILRDIAFSAQGGEVIALLGPSGVGKSTILRIVLGLDRQYDGHVRLQPGRLGVMFQEPRLLPWLSVADNLRLVRSAGHPEPDIDSLLQEVLLPPVAAMLPRELSLGMARRVALARALAVDPQTLVLDEPFASLDTNLAATLGHGLMLRARRNSMLIILSTHDLDQALALATRVLVVAGAPANLLADLGVPGDTQGRADLHMYLLRQFSFLGRNGA